MDNKPNSKKQDFSDLPKLPLDIWIEIFSWIQCGDMAKFSMACKFFYKFLGENSITIFKKANISFSEYEQQPQQQSLSHWQFFCKTQNDSILRLDKLPVLPALATSMDSLDVVLLGNEKLIPYESNSRSIQNWLTVSLSSSNLNTEGYTPCKLTDTTLRIWNTVNLDPALLQKVCKNGQVAIIIPASKTDFDTQLNNIEKSGNANMAVFVFCLANKFLGIENLTLEKKERVILLTINMLKKPQILFDQIVKTLRKIQSEPIKRNHRDCVLQ